MPYRLQVLGWTLIWSGVFVLGYFAWQLWGTDLINAGVQAEASEQLRETLEQYRRQPERIEMGDSIVDYFPEDAAAVGEPFGFLTIRKIELEEVAIFEGVDRATLQSGPGHVRSSPLPGQPGNAVMSGHRTTYGRPFFDFDLLEIGDEIEVETVIGTHHYVVREVVIVGPTDLWIADDRAGGWLTLTTCEPKFSARQRLVVFAELVDGPNFEFIQLNRDGAVAS